MWTSFVSVVICFVFVLFIVVGTIMEAPEITFMFQFGSIRDAVTVCASLLNLHTLKDMACQFIMTNVSKTKRYEKDQKPIFNQNA